MALVLAALGGAAPSQAAAVELTLSPSCIPAPDTPVRGSLGPGYWNVYEPVSAGFHAEVKDSSGAWVASSYSDVNMTSPLGGYYTFTLRLGAVLPSGNYTVWAGGDSGGVESDTAPLRVGGCDPVLFGKRGFVSGTSFTTMSVHSKRASPFTLYYAATVRTLGVFVDGFGSGTGASQDLRGVLYGRAADGGPGALLGRTFQFRVEQGRPGRWVELYMGPPIRLQPGVYWLGVHSGGPANVARFAWDAKADSRRFNLDDDGNGPNNPFGVAPSDNQQISIYASGSY